MAQRGALMLAILAVPITCVWCFATDDVLHALGVGDDETIALAVSFTRWSVFGFWPTLASRVLQGFLRAQRIVKPVMYCSSFAGLVTASISWLFVLQFGFIGAPLAQAFGAWWAGVRLAEALIYPFSVNRSSLVIICRWL